MSIVADLMFEIDALHDHMNKLGIKVRVDPQTVIPSVC